MLKGYEGPGEGWTFHQLDWFNQDGLTITAATWMKWKTVAGRTALLVGDGVTRQKVAVVYFDSPELRAICGK